MPERENGSGPRVEYIPSSMDLHIEWTRPIPVTRARGELLDFRLDLDAVPPEPGVYIFGRRWGPRFEALYVARADNMRARMRTHLNNLRLMRHLLEAKTGRRVLLAGELRTRPGQRAPKCLALAERALIRHFIAEGHDLVNKQGTLIRRHAVVSDGRHPKRMFPRTIFLEK